MLASKAFILGTMAFAIFSFYALFHSIYKTQLKFEDTSDRNLASEGDSTTWFQPKVKVVMVIIDAFRFDYLLNYNNLDHSKAQQVNKLNRFNKAFSQKPERFVVLRAQADAPTMTVLRVPCLMTGNVPRLGSVLTAFGALPSTEDSIPRQLFLHDKKSYFSGDPILKEYFPKYLESDFKIGSFTIGDWTVDQPVQAYINKKVEENKFDFLATHLLRLDHAGHSGGLKNHAVLNALDDIDRFLMHLMDTIDDDTMLLFAGDHGMSKLGTHGGDTPQEMNTAIVAYYKKGFMKYKHKNRHLKKIMRSINETNDQIHQIDIAPTLSMLMGMPTPFSNMGQILNDLYPVGDYLEKQDCPDASFDAAFDIQLLKDNHLNTLQVWNYFKKYHEGQSLYSQKEFSEVSDLFHETEALYKEAHTLLKKSQQCEVDFHRAVTKAIKNSQKLSNYVHYFVNTKTPHDLVIFWQALIILALVAVSYALLVQYVSKTKDYEHITLTMPKSWKEVAKKLIPITILLIIVWCVMLAKSPVVMRPMTSTALILALWTLGSAIVKFLSKQQLEESTQNIPSSPSTIEETAKPLFNIKKFFIFQNPLVTAGAIAIIGYLFYLTHYVHLNKYIITDYTSYTPHVFVLLAGARLSGRYLKYAPFIMATTVLLIIGLQYAHPSFLASKKERITLGLLLVADWLWGEIEFMMFKLKAGKVWSFQYVICFIVLVGYHLVCDPDTEFVQITLPRVIWALVALSCLSGFALRLPKTVIKRNFQINLVLFLTLMQLHRKFLFFGIVLSVMRITTFVFKRVQFKNYLYPLVLGLISYIGLFAIGYQDRKLPRSFEPAFVGMKEFNLALCMFLYGSAMFSTIILGMLFMSFYDQDLESQEVELGIQKEESECQAVALKGYSNIIKKRNVVLYCFMYNMIMIGAALNPILLKQHKKIFLSMERFLVDGAFYLFTINAVYFMI